MKSGRLLRHPALWFLLVMGALSAIAGPLNVPIGRVTEIGIYTLYAIAVNLLLGYTGLVSFGASLFFGAGTYAAALFALRIAPNEIGALAAATILAALFGFGVGALVLRRRGLYFPC